MAAAPFNLVPVEVDQRTVSRPPKPFFDYHQRGVGAVLQPRSLGQDRSVAGASPVKGEQGGATGCPERP